MDASLLEELKNEGVPVRPDGFGITVKEFASSKDGYTTTIARGVLDKMVQEGKLTKTLMIGGQGGHEYVYHRVEGK